MSDIKEGSFFQSPNQSQKIETLVSPHAQQQLFLKLHHQNSYKETQSSHLQSIASRRMLTSSQQDPDIPLPKNFRKHSIQPMRKIETVMNDEDDEVEHYSRESHQPQSYDFKQLQHLHRGSSDHAYISTADSHRDSNHMGVKKKRVQFSYGGGLNSSIQQPFDYQPAKQVLVQHEDHYPVEEQQNTNIDRELKTMALRRFKSGDHTLNSNNLSDQTQTITHSQPSIDFQMYNNNLNDQILYRNNDVIRDILLTYQKNNLVFSKFRIVSIDETGKLERIKLKVDQIRIAQREFQSQVKRQRREQRKSQQVAKSMQFNESIRGPQLHQIQPSHMLQKDQQKNGKFGKKGMQPAQSSCDFNQDMEDGILSDDDNEEDVIDCQEGNKTPFYLYTEGLSSKRPQVMFQNHEVMMFQSPRQQERAHDLRMSELGDEPIAQTQRLMEEDSFQDYNILETPAHRILAPKDEQDFGIPLAADYTDSQKKEIENSIINRSTNKNLGSRRQKLEGFKMQGTRKLEKKNLDSFRGQDAIKEEPMFLNLSDEDVGTPHQESLKDKSQGENKFIKNPTYARITHASKQMEFIGKNTGYRNDLKSGNFLMKSMPNFDLLKHIDKSQMPFDDISSSQGLQHTSTFLDVSKASMVQANATHKINSFGSPILNHKSVLNLKGSRFESPQQKIKQRQKTKLFEEFFIIGVDKDDLATLDWTKSKQQILAPKTLYMHNNQKGLECERRRVVKDFCFPDSIGVKLIKNKGEGLNDRNIQQLQKVLYQTKSARESSFIFTMNAEEDAQVDFSMSSERYNQYQETFPDGLTQDKFYNCLCVVFNDMVTDNRQLIPNITEKELEKRFIDSRIFSTKKAYCFMFANQHYQTHLEVIGFLINVLKDELIKLSKNVIKASDSNSKSVQSEQVLKLQLERDVMAMLMLPLTNASLLGVLRTYSCHDLVKTQVVDFGKSVGVLRHDQEATSSKFLDCKWFCPQLFSTFHIPTFLQLMTAVMLERSVIFVGKASMISSAILGLNSLLNPFKWCFAFVPILPHPLIDMVEAPVPLLVGITKKEYRHLNLSEDERNTKIWVFLESGHVVWSKEKAQNLPQFYFGGLQKILEEDYSSFMGSFIKTTLTSEEDQSMISDRSSMVSTISHNDANFLFDDNLKEKCVAICEKIRKSIKTFVLGSLKEFRKKNRAYEGENLVQEMGQRVCQSSSKNDRAFLEQFVQTQMFATYIEEILM